MSDNSPRLQMNDGHEIPQLGFGVFQIPPEDTTDAVAHALKTGYRHIDTAAAYGNEKEVAEGLRRSGIPREEVFITTKLWNADQGTERARRGFDRSLQRLGGEYVDLYLIHWPVPSRELYPETWQLLCELREEGLSRSIGVSNFQPEHLERIISDTGVVPAVNQVELHPRLGQPELRRFHEENQILTEAWSPLGQGATLKEDVIEQIASARERTPAQIVLRWHLQLGNVVIPKSVNPARIEENYEVFDFELSDDEMNAITELDSGERTGPDPATFAVA